MGEVYRATDRKLSREVALKVLPPDMARDPERLARFQREARAIAALNHPHIVTIFSVEEADGVHFLTMELVEGQSLDRRILEGGLPVEQILEIANALADALAAAHEKGIVHRDLKPANVMVTSDGRVKVLDFGLAKDIRADSSNNATLTSAGHTQAGIVMGTPAYMSPEQIAGRPLDHRTDIFSLGIILYEMATGRRPFEGTSSAELVSSILRDTPAAITSVRADLPPDLARIIRRCLEKDPRHRVQTARDVSNEFRDLERQSSPAATVPVSRAVAATPVSGAARTDEGFWVAVLPFKYTGANADLTALAEGLTEDIVTGLSRFSYLRVIARGSIVKYSSESGDVRAIGKELGARFIMEGSLRQAGTRLRLAMQLVDATSGAHLWAETYDRAFNPEAVFELQDELVPRIVSTVAETHGVLPYSMSQTLRNRNPDELTPYEALLRGFAYFKHVNAADHAGARAALEKAVQQSPGNADCLAMLSMLYREEYNHGYNLRPDPLGRALAAARRAVDAAPSNHLAHHALASVLYFRRELQAFRSAAQRAMELNPMDGFTLAYMGFQISFSGDWDRGCALMEKARSLNPNHPGWYWFPPFFNAYRKADYRAALEFALKVNMPGFWRNELALAATYGQLGELEMARSAAQELLASRPEFATTAREECRKWWDAELVEQILEGLRKAGLEIAPEGKSAALAAKPELVSTTGSGATRTDEGFWVAVLPFKYAGTSTELKALADGLSEEIVTGLSRFSYLRVIARGSTAKYSSESGDVRAIGKGLGARYVMEGSLRQAGTKLRLAVQLIDAVSGAHLWAENYERAFNPEAVFELHDDLVPRIVSTVADQYGILPRSMSESLRGKSEDQLTPHEAVLRAFSYFTRITPEEHAAIGKILERAVHDAPDHADSWAMLSMIYRGEFAQGFNARPNPLDRALAAAQRAVDLAATHALGHYALATVHFFRKEMIPFHVEAERTLALNPLDASVRAYLGLLIAASGEWDRGCQMVESAMQLNPNCPGHFYFARCCNGYRQGRYAEVLEAAARVNMPSYFHTHALRAAALGQLGRREDAQKALQDLLALRPDFADAARQEYAKWYSPELVEQLIDGLRKAGLEIQPEEATAAPILVSASPSASASGAAPAQERSAPDSSRNPRRSFALAIALSLLVIAAVGVGIYLKGSKAGRIDSIAVLPLDNRSNDPDADYISDGITESINNSLARLPSLSVTPHSLASHYKGKAMDVRKVGDELHVQAVLAGSVVQRGDDLTIDVELDDVRNGKQLWGEQYRRKLADLLVVQNDIAREVSQRLRSQLSAEEQKILTKGSTDNPEAYRLYLKGKYYTYKLTKEGFDTGIDYFNQAIAVDPNYGLAYSGLAFNYVNQDDWFLPPGEAVPKTKEAAKRALAIDESDAMAHLAIAIVAHWYDWNWTVAETEFKRTIELNPNSSEAHWYYAWFLASMRRNDQAIAEVKRSQQIDPLSAFPTAGVGVLYLFTRQWDPAIAQLRRAIAIDPTFWFSYSFLGRAYEQKGKLPEAIAQFQRALELEKENAEIWSGLGNAYAVSGNAGDARKVLDHLKELSVHNWVAPYNLAVIYAGLGEKDQAFALLERACADRSYYMPSFLMMDERLDNLHSDPRLNDLRRRVGLPE